MSSTSQGADLVLPILVGAGVLLVFLFALTIRLVSSWKGIWRLIALLPLLGMSGLVAYMVMHPDSAGLWPIVIVFWGFLAIGALAVIVGTHTLIQRLTSRARGHQ